MVDDFGARIAKLRKARKLSQRALADRAKALDPDLLFSAALLVLAFFPGIAYWASNLLGFQSPINFVYVVIIFLLLAKLFLLSIRVSQLDSRLRILTEQVALNQEKQESEKLDL